jgi:hypothetical protein
MQLQVGTVTSNCFLGETIPSNPPSQILPLKSLPPESLPLISLDIMITSAHAFLAISK